jgi:benzoyl-CoA reductase subunit C
MGNQERYPDFSFFRDVATDRHRHAQVFAKSRKLMGYFCDFVPEELLDAADFVPVRVLGTRKPVSLADKYLQSNVCSFARSCLELALDGTYRYLSGVVIPHSCDVITKMNDLWSYRLDYPDFCEYLWYPHKVRDATAREAFVEEIRRLKNRIEEFTDRPISDAALKESIVRHNESRRLLKQLYELRKAASPAVTGTEALCVTLSSLLVPKDEHSLRLQELLEALPQRAQEKPRPRILLSAAVLDDFELVEAIEGLGGLVVADDSCTGIRSFWGETAEDGDPIESIADRYLRKIPCPRSFDSASRTDFLMQNIRDYSADGVIMYILRCCDAHLFQLPDLQQKLKAAGVPVLYLQGDHSTSIAEETRNRIAAFIEMLGG